VRRRRGLRRGRWLGGLCRPNRLGGARFGSVGDTAAPPQQLKVNVFRLVGH